MSDRIIDEHYVENTWTCTSCQIANRGRDMVCASCSSPKDKSESDAPADASAPAVTDPELLKKAKAGPNRLCPFCDSQNRALDGKCPECGADRGEQKPAPDFDRKIAIKNNTAKIPASPRIRGRESRRAFFIGIAISIAVSVLFVGAFWLFSSHLTHATVTSATWSITRNLRTRATLHDSGWGSPSGAFNTSCQTRYYGDRNCNPYDCNAHQESYSCRPHDCRCSTYTTTSGQKNGFSRVTTHQRCDTCYDSCSRSVHDTCYRQCPVYRDWCEYDYYEWPITATLTTAGSGQNVYDPPLEAGELQRIDQIEDFKAVFSHKDRTWSLSPMRAEYARYAIGSEWSVEVNRAGGFKVLGPRETQ